MSDLSSNRPPCGSLHPFGSGRSFHPLSRILPPGVRFVRNPTPAGTSSTFASRLVGDPTTHVRIDNVLSGFPRSTSVTESLGFYLSAGDRCVSVCAPSKRTSGHVPFWAGPLRRLSPFSLTTFIGSSLSLTLSIQPSASFGFVFRNHTRPPHGDQRTPLGGYICRALSTDCYQYRTALLATGG